MTHAHSMTRMRAPDVNPTTKFRISINNADGDYKLPAAFFHRLFRISKVCRERGGGTREGEREGRRGEKEKERLVQLNTISLLNTSNTTALDQKLSRF